ncbi:MAG TPA: ABC transporter permease subunit, partial [Planctomycetota bacterium]|nr:ABC transporter permease subunit [Planctomycetota bacterium]
EEQAGTADLLLTHPVSRRRVVLERFLALVLLTAAPALAIALVIFLGNRIFRLGVPTKGVLGANASLWLLGIFFGALAMALSAWRGRRGGSAAITAAVAIAMFFLNFFAPRIRGLDGLDVGTAFFWYYRSSPILQGANPGHLVLVGAIGVLAALAVLAFARRDIGVLREHAPRRSGVARGGMLDRLLDSVYGHALWRRRVSVWWWAGGLSLLGGLTAGFWPLLRGGPKQLEGVIRLVPREVLASFGINDPAAMLTAAGFLTGRVYGSLGLIVLLVFAIATGTAEIAGDMRNGTLDLVLAAPIGRRRLVLQRWAGMATLILVVVAALTATIAVSNDRLALEIPAHGLLAANLGLALLALFFGTLAMAVGSSTGSVKAARGVPTAVAIAGFLCNALGAASPKLAVLQSVSPLHWYLGDTPPLARGLGPGVALLAAGVVAMVAAAVCAFARRDIVADRGGGA